MANMFDPHQDYVRVVRCRDCEKSYTPIRVPPGTKEPVVVARFCGVTNRIKSDEGYCDEGKPRKIGSDQP